MAKQTVKAYIFWLMEHIFKDNFQIIRFLKEFIIHKDLLIMEILKQIYLMVKELNKMLDRDINSKGYLDKEGR